MADLKTPKYGDTYYCYRHYTAISVLGCVDACGMFTYLNVGRPGSVGDSYSCRHSMLMRNSKTRNG